MPSQKIKELPVVRTALGIKKYYGTMLESISSRVDALDSIDQSLLANDTSLLESTIYLVKSLQKIQSESQRLHETLLRYFENLQRQLQSAGKQQSEGILERLEEFQARNTEQSDAFLAQLLGQLNLIEQHGQEQGKTLLLQIEEIHRRSAQQLEELQGPHAQQARTLLERLEEFQARNTEQSDAFLGQLLGQLNLIEQHGQEQGKTLLLQIEEIHRRSAQQLEELQGPHAQQAGTLLERLDKIDEQGQLRQEAMLSHFEDVARQSVEVARQSVEEGKQQQEEAFRQFAEERKQQQEEAFRQSAEERKQQQEALLSRLNELETFIETHFSKNTTLVETDSFELLNPEVGLMAHLYSYLPNRNALDVGANIGEVSERLLKSGYNVYAFEPFPPVYEKLKSRFGDEEAFHSQQIAIGFVDRAMELHVATDASGDNKYKDYTQFSSLIHHSMPDDLIFTKTLQVPVRSLESLRRAGEIPEDVGLLKIDTEGYDLEVIRGMGEQRPAVVVAEFWDPAFPFGKAGALNWLESLVREMRQRDYHWHIIIYRVWGKMDISFYCNQTKSVDSSWGNVFFFRDQHVFMQALQWCSAVLPPTYFNA